MDSELNRLGDAERRRRNYHRCQQLDEDECKEPDRCAVCLTDATKDSGAVLLLPCSHSFHGNCILQWVEVNFNCPMCRQEIDQFIPLGDESEEMISRFTAAWEKHHYIDKTALPPAPTDTHGRGKETGGKGQLQQALGGASGKSVEEQLPSVEIPLEESEIPLEEVEIPLEEVEIPLEEAEIEGETGEAESTEQEIMIEAMPEPTGEGVVPVDPPTATGEPDHPDEMAAIHDTEESAIVVVVADPQGRAVAALIQRLRRDEEEELPSRADGGLLWGGPDVVDSDPQHRPRRVHAAPGLSLSYGMRDPLTVLADMVMGMLQSLPPLVDRKSRLPEITWPSDIGTRAYPMQTNLGAGFVAGGITSAVVYAMHNRMRGPLFPVFREVSPNVALFFMSYEHLKSLAEANGEEDRSCRFLKRTLCAGLAAAIGHLPRQSFDGHIPIRFGLQFGFFELFKDDLCRSRRLKHHHQLNALDIAGTTLGAAILANYLTGMFQLSLPRPSAPGTYLGLLAREATNSALKPSKLGPACVCAVAYEYARRMFYEES